MPSRTEGVIQYIANYIVFQYFIVYYGVNRIFIRNMMVKQEALRNVIALDNV